MSLRAYAYGLTALAAVTGGLVMFYQPAPGPILRPDTAAELMEGYNERLYVLHESDRPTDDYDTSIFFTNLTGRLRYTEMHKMMKGLTAIAPHFVRSYTPTSVVMWTAPALFQACGVGPADGTQALFTVHVPTNGIPVYSNHPAMTVTSNLLWECYRLMRAMTQTVATALWESGPWWQLVSTNYPPYADPALWGSNRTEWFYASESYEGTNLPLWVWYNLGQADPYQWLVPEGSGQALFETISWTAAFDHDLWTHPWTSFTNFVGFEELVYAPRLPQMGYTMTGTTWTAHIGVLGYSEDYPGTVGGSRVCPTSVVSLYVCMAAGVTSTVDHVLRFDAWIGSEDGAFATNTASWSTNAIWTVGHTGLVEGLYQTMRVPTDLVEIEDLFILENYIGGHGDWIDARGEWTVPRDPVVSWQFTRCR